MTKGFSHFWTKKQLKEHVRVVRGEIKPTVILEQITYLNSLRRTWVTANIWIYEDRIVYIGQAMPEDVSGIEIIDGRGRYAVPGYIEHHAHPFQLYNPMTFAAYAAERGTTTIIGDNLPLFLHQPREKALALLDELQKSPASLLWSVRYDSQTELKEGDSVFSYANIRAWLHHPYVVQGGELTGWPALLNGDEQMLHSLVETKDLRKPVEGHFPGAGEKTLTQMALLGVNGDHESMTGEEVIRRLDAGLHASLRYSTIRPDLPNLVRELHELGLDHYEGLMMTTDGSPPHGVQEGMMEHLIQMAVDEGVPFIDAVHMVTLNPARHFYMDDVLGILAPGRIANINILSSKEDPVPVDVLAKGTWVRRSGRGCFPDTKVDWAAFGLPPLDIDWELTDEDFHFSMPLGLSMENDVLLKPYQIGRELLTDELPEGCGENFMIMIDRNGKWNVSTLLKGFADNLYGFASSFSTSGDIMLIGSSKEGMKQAFARLKEIGGGIVLLHRNGQTTEIPLEAGGLFSTIGMKEGLLSQEAALREELRRCGYPFGDPVYSLLFFSATHLPYVRITQKGIVDVKKKRVLFPALMR
ncbi:adenine deaminase C-terminal domain-containing protein [Alkalicoccus urumqiensis]|uniref:adenine deaminase n=1 Tax=Alkalicoccus urumqiensis TaxID=1548213 RepID=A0A2P6MIX7_ALKUR|nr:adenine deaminase C-terminal domain-containing protein [Alkalicoccus urumqiensis]PRO66235.1 adenosine deaminase [Alkalicoccus urumqiensis]